MTILVTYASKHGATAGIAERIGSTLRHAGHAVAVLPVEGVDTTEAAAYDAFVIGGAAYYSHWLKEATRFVRQNRGVLSQRAVWLFSSGPIGSNASYAGKPDPRQTLFPREFASFEEAIHPRGVRVFFGALDRNQLHFPEGLFGKAMPEGDFRDWDDIDTWAEEIARALAPAGATTH